MPNNHKPRITADKLKQEPLTREKLEPIVQDLKDFIKATARNTESFLEEKLKNEIHGVRGEIQKLDLRLTGVEKTVEGHSNAIMELSHDVKELKTEMHEMGNRLSGVEKHVSDISGKMDKIGSIAGHVDDHETRITSLENASQ